MINRRIQYQTDFDQVEDEYETSFDYIHSLRNDIPMFYWCPSRTPTRDQGLCGACWAFSIVHMLEDRFLYARISTPTLSVAQLLFCDWNDDLGKRLQRDPVSLASVANKTCFGNSLLSALRYMYVFGTPSEACVPLSTRTLNADIRDIDTVREVPFCASITSPYEDMCADYDMYSSGEVFGDASKRYRCHSIYAIPSGLGSLDAYVNWVQREILTYGPVVSMIPLDDMWFQPFEVYHGMSSAVPKYGFHAIEVVGWDHVSRFWWVRNTYGTEWGVSGGYARIAYGTDGIEKRVCTARVDMGNKRSVDEGVEYVVPFVGSERQVLYDIKYGTLDENVDPISGVSYRTLRLRREQY